MQFQGKCWVCHHLSFGSSCSDVFSYLLSFMNFMTGAAVSTALGLSLSPLQAALDADDECTSKSCARDSGDGHGDIISGLVWSEL